MAMAHPALLSFERIRHNKLYARRLTYMYVPILLLERLALVLLNLCRIPVKPSPLVKRSQYVVVCPMC